MGTRRQVVVENRLSTSTLRSRRSWASTARRQTRLSSNRPLQGSRRLLLLAATRNRWLLIKSAAFHLPENPLLGAYPPKALQQALGLLAVAWRDLNRHSDRVLLPCNVPNSSNNDSPRERISLKTVTARSQMGLPVPMRTRRERMSPRSVGFSILK